MDTDNNGLMVRKGDIITIASHIIVTGTVASVEWYQESGWRIELTNANVAGGYSSWKQRYDGGRIVAVNGVRV